MIVRPDVCRERCDPVEVAKKDSAPGLGLAEPLAAELTQELEHAKPLTAGLELATHERLLDQRREQHRNLLRCELQVAAHLLGGIELEPSRKDRESRPQESLRIAEQLVAPVDGGFQRLLAR